MIPKRVLLTGGAGFVGSHLAQKLASLKDIEVIIIIDNLSMSRLDNIKSIVSNPKVEFIRGDVSDYNMMSFLLNKHQIDTVYHMAVTPLVFSLKEPKISTNNIIGMQQTILECQRRGFFKKLISFSTSEVYGSSDGKLLTESDSFKPRTPYAAAKASCDLLIQSYYESFGIDYTIIRLFNNYGPRKQVFIKQAGIIPTTIKLLSQGKAVPIFGDGKYRRDFTFIDDTIRAVIMASKNNNASGKLFIISSGQTRSVKQIVIDISRLMNVEPKMEFLPERQGDVSFLCGNAQKAKEVLGFEPETKWEDGLKECINYYM
jgi:UDP-glucose 4-epimerase